jgi:hypothetical protein
MPNSLLFFATAEDLRPCLEWFENHMPIYYYLNDPSPSEGLTQFESVRSIPKFGISRSGSTVFDPEYIILPQGIKPITRYIENGPERGYVLTSNANDLALLLRPGGVFGEKVLMAGSIGCSESEKAVSMFRKLRSRLIKGCVKANRYYIGTKAASEASTGTRLVPMDAGQDIRFDIRIVDAH